MSGAVPFDDRDGVIWQDGAFVPWRDAQLHVLSHGLHYGGAVFEGVRVYDRRPFRLTDHSRRLCASAAELGYRIPYGVAELDRATEELIRKQNIVDGYVRPVAWRGSEQLSVSGAGNTVRVAIAAWEWPHVFAAGAREHGIRLGTSRWRRPAPDTAPVRAKAAALYTLGTLARDEVEARGFDDALLLDHRGLVAEATGANLFLVRDGALHTPVADTFLDGLTRRTVLALAERHGIEVHQRRVLPAELAEADEVFLTGTAYEVQPVGGIDDHTYAVGPVTRLLAQAYTEAVHAPWPASEADPVDGAGMSGEQG